MKVVAHLFCNPKIMNLEHKKDKLYTIICKTNADKFVKYRCSDLLSLVNFLDTSYPGWRWFNVYDKKTKEQIANFTTNRRPISKRL